MPKRYRLSVTPSHGGQIHGELRGRKPTVRRYGRRNTRQDGTPFVLREDTTPNLWPPFFLFLFLPAQSPREVLVARART